MASAHLPGPVVADLGVLHGPAQFLGRIRSSLPHERLTYAQRKLRNESLRFSLGERVPKRRNDGSA